MRTLALSLLGVLAFACSLSTNVDRFDDGVCGSGTKSCNGACSQLTDPTVGCAAAGCAPCNLTNATAVCMQGTCSIHSCVAHYDDCNGVVSDGCETDLQHDPMNCGDCGCRCGTGDPTNCSHRQDVTPILRGTPGCAGSAIDGTGHCAVGTCDPGWGDCNGMVDDGCETATNTDDNCGTCGTLCAAPAHCVCTMQDGGTGCACAEPDAGD